MAVGWNCNQLASQLKVLQPTGPAIDWPCDQLATRSTIWSGEYFMISQKSPNYFLATRGMGESSNETHQFWTHLNLLSVFCKFCLPRLILFMNFVLVNFCVFYLFISIVRTFGSKFVLYWKRRHMVQVKPGRSKWNIFCIDVMCEEYWW